jgi:hypothetical protein
MSASDEKQLDAEAKLVEANDAESSPTIDHDAAESLPPSSLRRKFKLYGALVAILVVALLAAAGAYPYWRTNASLVLARVGLDLENLEMSLNVPRWAITHVGEPRQDDIQDAEARVSSRVPSKPIASQSPVKAAPTGPMIDKSSNPSAEWRDAMPKWADRLASVQVRLSLFEERLEALEHKSSDGLGATAANSGILIPDDLAGQIEALANRLGRLEDGQDQLKNAETAPTQIPSTHSAALIGTLVGLAERVAAMEARAAADAVALAVLWDDAQALTSRVTGLVEQVRDVGVALDKDSPARDRASLLLLSIGQLAEASRSGPYEAHLASLRAVAGDQLGLSAPMERLAPIAPTGAPTLVRLRARFSEASSAVIRSRDVGPSEGILGQTLSRVASLVTIRKIDDAGAGTVDGALAAADTALGVEDLAAAVMALEALDGAPGDAIAEWIEMARARLVVDEAIQDLRSAAVRALAAAG